LTTRSGKLSSSFSNRAHARLL